MKSKRILFMFVVLVLCRAASSAQNMNTTAYNQWVDYVKCYYLEAYCEKKKTQKNTEGRDFTGIYTTEIAKYLNEVVSDSANISNLDIKMLDELQKIDKCKKLIEHIETKKKNFDPTWDKAQIVNALTGLPNNTPGTGKYSFAEFLKEKKGELKTLLNKKISLENKDLKKSSATTPSGQGAEEDDSEGSTTKQSSAGMTVLWFFIFVIIIASLIIWKREYLKRKLLPQDKSKRLRTEFEREGIIKLRKRIEELEAQNEKLKQENDKLLRENIELGSKVEDYEYKKEIGTTSIPKISHSVLYSDAIIDGYFYQITETPNEDTVFELHLHNDQTATFTIYNNAYRRIVVNPSFLEGCDKQVLNNTQNVRIENKGEARRQADGKWEIIKKLNLIID